MQIFYGDPQALRRRMTDGIRTALKNGQKCLVLVPEMATLKTEQELLSALQLQGFFDVQVLSPSRMSERVFEQEGMGDINVRIRIGDTGKMMAVSAAVGQCEKELCYYAGAAHRQGFIAHMAQLIADLKRSQISPEQLTEYVDTLQRGASRDKLCDTALIYGAYCRLMENVFADGEDVTDALISKLENTRWQENTCLFAIGFDMITQQFARTLTALEKGSRPVTLLMRCETDAPAYAPVMESVGRLNALCSKAGIPCQTTVLAQTANTEKYPLNTPVRAFLHGQVYKDSVTRARLYAAATPYDEMRFVAREILRLKQSGIPFSHMTVAFCDMGGYEGVTESVFHSFDIPFYLPRKMPMASHGAARFLLSSLRAVDSRYDPQDMLDVLRSGYTQVDEALVFSLENYILAYGIRGKMFLSPFTRGDSEECVRLDSAREQLISPLETLRTALKTSESCTETLTAVYAYLESCGVFRRLMQHEEMLLEKGMPAQAAQGRQVWNFLMKLLDEMNELSGHLKMTTRQVRDMMEAGIEQQEISALPPDGGSVMCARVGDLSGEETDVLFICNASDGVMNAAPDAMLTEEERLALEKHTDSYISLSLDGRDDLKFLDFYHTLCAATRQVFFTRSIASQSGESRLPHLFLHKLRRSWPLLAEEGGVTAARESSTPLSPLTAAEEVCERFLTNRMDTVWQNAWRYLCTKRPDLARQVQSAFVRPDDTAPLSRDTTKALFLERIMSVSRLESYAACPYQHFVRYGLAAQPRKEWKIQSQDAGNFYHSAMEGFTRLLPSIPNWPRITKKDCDAWMDKVSEDLLETQFGPLMQDSARTRYAGERYRKVLRRVAWAFTKGAQHSKFNPQGSEVRFGYGEDSLPPVELTLDNGKKVLLRGIIDRIDRFEGDEGVFLRVVDYKSGSRDMDATQIFYGRQLQLLIYLLAAVESEKDSEPAGAYYFSLKDPLIEDPMDLTLAEQKLAEKLHLKGITLKDAKIVHLMDDAQPPMTMPKLLKQDGEFLANKPVAELSDLRKLLMHARDTARELCESMRRGDIAAHPLTSASSPCDYCDYAGICRREDSRPRRVDTLTFDELIEKINARSDGTNSQ